MGKRILQLGKFYPVRGGVEKVMYDLCASLGRRGVRCDMLCASTECRGVIPLDGCARVICMPALVKVKGTMLSPAMVRYLRAHASEYDVIHIHHPDPMAALALRLSGYKGRVILHWHSDIVSQRVLLKLYLPLQRWLIRRVETVIGTTSRYLASSPYLAEFQDKTAVVPIGIDPIVPDPARVAELKASCGGRRTVLSLGRFVPYKGLDNIVAAAALLPEGYKVVMAGDGPLREDLMKKSDGLGILFPGLLSEEDKAAWIGACDVLVLSSVLKTEAFGIVQLEAMSASRPVVATDIPGSGTGVVCESGISGIVVPPHSPEAIADAVRTLCDDPERHDRYCRAALERYRALYTLDAMASACMKIYENE